MYNSSFEYISNLQYSLKAARKQLEELKSGEKYVRISQEHKKMVRAYEQQIRHLKRELALAHQETITVRNLCFQQFEDLEKARDRERKQFECCATIKENRSRPCPFGALKTTIISVKA